MKHSRWIGGTLLAFLMVVTVLAVSAEARRERTARQAGWTLSADEAETLKYLREEEKLARDVYRMMYQLYQVPIFANISRSEERHTLQIRRLLSKYGVEDPVVDDADGVFVHAQLQTLYNQLIDTGNLSLSDALKAGALIEETDIADLQEALQNTAHADIRRVCSHLMEASRSHLRAFVGQIEGAGGVYTPEVLTQEEFDGIVN